MVDDSPPEELTLYYLFTSYAISNKKRWKISMAVLQMWQTISCIPSNPDDNIEESWSPPR